MAKPNEKSVEDPIKQLIESRGGWCIKHHASISKAGIPDILAIYKGFALGIEVKRPVGGVTKVRQKKNLNEIANAGGIAISANSVEIVQTVLDVIDGKLIDLTGTIYVNCGLESIPNVYDESQVYGVWNDVLLKIGG